MVQIIVWNLKRNVEACSHLSDEKDVFFCETPSGLFFITHKEARDAVTGIKAFDLNVEDGVDRFKVKFLKVAALGQVAIEYDGDVSFKKRMCRLMLPNKAWHSKFQKDLLDGGKNYVLAVPELLFFKDPESGESIFTQIGMDAKM